MTTGPFSWKLIDERFVYGFAEWIEFVGEMKIL